MMIRSRPAQSVTLAATLAFLAGPAFAQETPFDRSIAETCLENGGGATCIGTAALACMEADGGPHSLAFDMCFSDELVFWDESLVEVRAAIRAVEEARMADLNAQGVAAADSLAAWDARAGAWQAYAEAACFYVETTYGGGTGGTEGALRCLVDETAQEVLKLREWLELATP